MKNLWTSKEVKKRFDELNTFYTKAAAANKLKCLSYLETLTYILEHGDNLYKAQLELRKECRFIAEDIYDLILEELEEFYEMYSDKRHSLDEVWCDDLLTIKDRINKMTANLFSNLKTDSYIFKEDDIITAVKADLLKLNNSLSMLTISELNHALINCILDEAEDKNITLYRYIAELDEKTCDICYLLNGRVFDIKDAKVGINLPLLHPNCRCTIAIYNL